MPVILDGKRCAEKVKDEVRERADRLSRSPCLAVVSVGDDPASKIYINGKRKDCQDCGILFKEYHRERSSTSGTLDIVNALNNDDSVDGIIVQLPLPKNLDTQKILQSVSFDKDVDGFTIYNAGRLSIGDPYFVSCTPAGIMRLLDEYHIPIRGSHCVIVNRSNIVGKPLERLMLQNDATVTVCHSITPYKLLGELIASADIFVSAVGNRNYLTNISLKSVPKYLVDVAMNRDENGKLHGDIPDSWFKRCDAYTPVPGGIGPMTRAMLMQNVVASAERRQR